jgi:hypothetical protein
MNKLVAVVNVSLWDPPTKFTPDMPLPSIKNKPSTTFHLFPLPEEGKTITGTRLSLKCDPTPWWRFPPHARLPGKVKPDIPTLVLPDSPQATPFGTSATTPYSPTTALQKTHASIKASLPFKF